MNPLFVSRALKSISYSELPEGVREEFAGRQPWSFYRLPDWMRRAARVKPPRKSVELANIKKEHGQ